MAPAVGRRARDVQFPHELGKVGRRTGITVPDSGVRDENGLEPMDHLFSSPEKAAPVNGNEKGGAKNMQDTTNSSEEDMDVVDSTIPEPFQVLNDRQRASLRPPRSKSPRKTFLQSPAKHNPAMGRGSSVDRMDSVVRQLDFTNGESLNSRGTRAATSPRQLPKTVGKNANPNQSNGIGSANKLKRPFAFEEEEDESIAPVGGDMGYEETEGDQEVNPNEPAQNGDGVEIGGIVEDEEEAEEELENQPEDESVDQPEEPVVNAKASKGLTKRRGRSAKSKAAGPKAAEPHVKEAHVSEAEGGRGKGRGRRTKAKPALAEVQEDENEVEEEAAPANDDDDEDVTTQRPKRQKLSPVPEQPKRGRGRPTAVATAQTAQGPKDPKATKVKKVKAPKAVASSPEIIRQPPIPNANRGLFISRRETTNGLLQTRSGRHSIKPIAHWRNERVIFKESEIPNQTVGHFNTIAKQSIAEIVRVDEAEPQKRTIRNGRAKPKGNRAKSSKKRVIESEDEDDEAEQWESEPGRIVGDVRVWNPFDPTSSHAGDMPEEIALSNAAIQTRDIPGSTFKFAKTLTLPFFGSGMVDIPAGGIKKPKNSRKMHMCFFVFSGRVKVTVNDNEFRIGKGGMWQVPRGNFYSIENDYEKPARIFFAQGCEVEEAIRQD